MSDQAISPNPAFRPASVMENDGMQWLVLGFAPGFEFISAHETRAQANAALDDEHNGRTFDYYAVVKARDFYRFA